MGNRQRLAPGVKDQTFEFIREKLTEQGFISEAQVRNIASLVGRDPRTVRRYVSNIAEDLGIELRPGAAPELGEERGVNALVSSQPFTFAEPELMRLTLAYAGNIAALHRDAETFARAQGLEGPLSYKQLARKFKEELRLNQREMIRGGIRGFKAASLYVRWSAAYRNETWQIDATTMDFWMLPFGSSERVRPNALFIIDDYSRVILAASLMLHDYTAEDSAACVHRAMRIRQVTLPDGRIIDIGGLPEKILCDNALQFTGQVLSYVAMQLGFTMWAVAAYAGEKKGKVERVIRSANESFARQLPGYANRNLKTLSLRDQLHARDDDLLDEQQALDELGKWVEEWNHSPHPNVPGKSRYEVWADDNHAIEHVDEELLRPATIALPRPSYICHKDGFRVQRGGIKRYYIDSSLKVEVRGRYLLRHLPDDTTWVDAYELDGTFVARCFDSSLLDETVKQQIEQRRQQTYRQLASLRSEAVELRALAAASAKHVAARPNAVATAHQSNAPTSDLVAASLGLLGDADAPETLAAPELTVNGAATLGAGDSSAGNVPAAAAGGKGTPADTSARNQPDYDALADDAVAGLTGDSEASR